MYCPICKQTLAQTGAVLVCPAHHGALVTGKFLHDIDEVQDTIAQSSSKAVGDTKDIVACPHCSHQMHKVNYNNTGVIIDVCTHCHYRWLDAGEISKIKNYKPIFKSEDLLFVDDLERRMNSQEAIDPTKTNPKVPLFNLARLISGGNSHRTLGAIGGMGLYGIIVGLIKSKFLRIVIFLLLVFFGVAYLLIYSSFR